MDAPSPCTLRCLGDPPVALLLRSGFRCLVRRRARQLMDESFTGEAVTSPPNYNWQSSEAGD